MDRRSFLALCAVALGSAGCTSGAPGPLPTRPPGEDSAEDPDAAIRRRVADSEAALIAAHRLAIAGHPELAAVLAPLVVHHEEHLARVAPGTQPGSTAPGGTTPSEADDAPGTTPGEAASPSPSDQPTASAERDDSSPSAALEALARAEESAQHQRVRACDAAEDAALTRDLCLIAASEAQHAEWLDRAARREAE